MSILQIKLLCLFYYRIWLPSPTMISREWNEVRHFAGSEHEILVEPIELSSCYSVLIGVSTTHLQKLNNLVVS